MSAETKSRYLDFLPAIFQEHSFLGQALLPFEDVLTGFDKLLSVLDHYFSPALTDPEFLPWLANWVALVLDEDWDEAKKRRLIGAAVDLYRQRGTVKGLQHYLEIYTDLVPEIRECRWPGGMQIGVASSIGGTAPDGFPLSIIQSVQRSKPLVYYDYYVVDTIAPADHPVVPPGDPLQLYYRADRVDKVEVGKDTVDIWHFPSDDAQSIRIHHEPAKVIRRDRLIDEHYSLMVAAGPDSDIIDYTGDTFLIDEVEQIYRFVVDVRVPAAELENVKLDKVRAIVDLEKPAHTMYYLKLTPVEKIFILEPMQIDFRSTIGVDTIVG